MKTNNFIATKQYKQFSEFCRACHRDHYIGLCYGPPGVGKTEAARHYSKWYQVKNHFENSSGIAPSFSMSKLNTVLYTPSILDHPRTIIYDIKELQREFNQLKRRYLYRKIMPIHVMQENQDKNFAELVIIDEAERLKPQAFEMIRELYDNGAANFIFIGMLGLEKILSRYPQLYSRLGFIHQFINLGKAEVIFILKRHFKKLNLEMNDNDFNDQEVISAIIRMTQGNFRLINRLLKQAARLMKVNCMGLLTKEILEAARGCLLIGE